jgi:ABC-type lipoprotein export system ATPase subunit
MAGSRVTLEGVSRAHGGVLTLRHISFDVAPGELIALTGPSGSGKTTLLQLIGSLDKPTSGSITVDDVAVQELKHPASFRRDTVGFVFQLHHLLPALTAQQNVELTLIAAGRNATNVRSPCLRRWGWPTVIARFRSRCPAVSGNVWP